MSKRVIYVIGSLKNDNIPVFANKLRELNPEWEVFDSWYAPGPNADDYLRDYCKGKNFSYKETLQDHAATHIFEFDKKHISRSTDVVMVMPCGKSGHLELGWASGKGIRSYVLFDKEPERVDIMYQFATDIFFDFKELAEELKGHDGPIKESYSYRIPDNGMKYTPLEDSDTGDYNGNPTTVISNSD